MSIKEQKTHLILHEHDDDDDDILHVCWLYVVNIYTMNGTQSFKINACDYPRLSSILRTGSSTTELVVISPKRDKLNF